MQNYSEGQVVWFYNPHVASYPCDSNTWKGLFKGHDFTDSDQQDWVRVEGFDGEGFSIPAGCVSTEDPRIEWKQRRSQQANSSIPF